MADWPSVPGNGPKGPTPALDLQPARAWTMVQRNRDVYWKTWKTNFLPPLLEPLLYLLSFGYGIGMFITDGVQDGFGNKVPYQQFVAAAILCITMMQAAFFETTYNSFVRMWFQKTWEAVTATPLTLDDVLAGELAWAACKSSINATLMSLVVACFGLIPWYIIPLVPVVAFVAGLLFAGLGLIVSARVKGIDGFSFAIYLFITPMMLFSGTFFPLHNLPPVAQGVALALPLTHTVLIVRPLVEGHLGDIPWTSIVYLLCGAVLAPVIAMRLMKRKLVI